VVDDAIARVNFMKFAFIPVSNRDVSPGGAENVLGLAKQSIDALNHLRSINDIESRV
jgi:hypothetical protein